MNNNTSGKRMYEFSSRIFPYLRSITGQGVRDTLKDIEEYISQPEQGYNPPKLNICEIPTGTKVFDWTVPREWIIREAYIENEKKEHIIDIKDHNLHVLGYSLPVDEWVDLEELKKHVYVEEKQPEVIPYVTSYYKDRFGFCMSKDMLDSLPEGKYHMYVDSELIDGHLTYADVIIPGDTDREIMFSTYFCHPSMANNECSGLALAAELIRFVAEMPSKRFTYRFVFVPETIGSITYLATENHVDYLKKHLEAGFVLSCVGDNRDYSIVRSKYGDTLADRALSSVLKYKDHYTNYPFRERGSDERQYNSAGVDLPVVCFCRSKFGEYPEYHTSADNLDLISEEGYQGSFDAMSELIRALEYNRHYNMKVMCEPQLGKRGLYPDISRKGSYDAIMTQRDVISYADGRNDLIDLSEIINVPADEIIDVIDKLIDADLIEALD